MYLCVGKNFSLNLGRCNLAFIAATILNFVLAQPQPKIQNFGGNELEGNFLPTLIRRPANPFREIRFNTTNFTLIIRNIYYIKAFKISS